MTRILRIAAANLTAYIILPAVLLVGLEFGCRAVAPSDLSLREGDAGLVDRRGSDFPHVNRPDFRGSLWQRKVSLNSRGHRGPEPRQQARRLLLIGDSVMFGVGVDDDEAPAAVLGPMLPDTITVMNAAVIGYSTEHALAYLEEFGDELEPDALILGYSLNDPVPAGEETVLTVGEIRRRFGRLDGLNAWLRSHSMLFLWLKDRFSVYRVRHGFDVHRQLFEGESWSRNRDALLNIHDWTRARSIPFGVAIFPHRDQLIPSIETDDQPQQLILEAGLDAGFPVLDLRPYLAPEHYLANDGIHLDADGIRAAMQAIAELMRTELLPRMVGRSDSDSRTR